jgi:hypothetical protein
MNRNLATIIIIINFRVLAIKIPKISFISAFWFLTLYFGKTISPVRKRLISFPVRRRLAACRRPARGPSGCYFGSLFFSSLSLSLSLSRVPFLGSFFLSGFFSLSPLALAYIFSSASAIRIHFSCLQFEFICFWAISFFLSLSLSLSVFGWCRNELLRVRFLPSSPFFWDCGFWRSTGDSWKVFFCVERSVPAKKGVLGLCLERKF